MRKGRIARSERITRAKIREEAHVGRTPQQQLDILDEKLGTGLGAVRERRRLLQRINNPNNKKTDRMATTKSQRRKEKADRHARRKENGN